MVTRLPTTLTVDEREYTIRTDFRDILECICALNDQDLSKSEKIYCVLFILFEDFNDIENYEEAFEKAMWFLSCGKSDKKDLPKRMDWEQDFDLIAPPVNRVLGFDCRSVEHLHWWTFVGAYMEIGECPFQSVVSIRIKRQKGKKLEDYELEYYREHMDEIDLKTSYSAEDDDIFSQFGV